MPVTFVYDPEADAGFLKVGEGPSVETETASDSINLDFNAKGELVAIEIMNVSKTAPGLLAKATKAVAAE